MNVEFVRFNATDSVELQGWLTNQPGEVAALHVHGMSGNGYENRFLDDLRATYAEQDISFFSIDTRGRGVVSWFKQGDDTKLAGSCYELFEESAHDIQGAVDYLKSLGKSAIILEGHSLGCSKVVNYLVTQEATDITKAVLLAPTDMVGWAGIDPKHTEHLAKAKELLAQGKGEELVGAQCWLDKTPLSAQTYPTICEAGGPADMYGDRDGGALLSHVALPMLIAYGDADIGITRLGSMQSYMDRVNATKHANTTLSVIEGAPHNYAGHESELVQAIKSFVEEA